jgi:hypothetical protein
VDADPRWCCTYLLDPSDALFIDVGQAFITQQIKGPLLSFVSFRVWYFNLFKFLGTSTQMILEVAKFSQSVVRVDF